MATAGGSQQPAPPGARPERGQAPAWRLAGEIGPLGQAPSPFAYPSVAQLTAAGTLLVVDRCRPANRIVELDRRGRQVWSFEGRPRVNFAHRLDAERVLFTQENAVRTVDRAGRVRLLAELAGSARFDAGCVAGDSVYVGGDDGIDVLTLDGHHQRHLPSGDTGFRNPVDIDVLPDGGLLVADGWTSAVVELSPGGRRRGIFGRWRSPGRTGGRLNVPKSACRLRSGATLVADTMAHRLVEFDPGGRVAREFPVRVDGGLFAPAFVRQTPEGLLLVADTGNRRVLLLHHDGTPELVAGPRRPPARMLSLPRSAVPTPDGGVLVCDAGNDRVVEVGVAGVQRWSFGRGASSEDPGLRIPRTASAGADGLVYVADGLNGRVLVADRAGRVRREIDAVRVGAERTALADPHLAVALGEDVLLVDSDLQRVFLVDRDGRALKVWGQRGELDDPHTAVLRPDGTLLVSDSGNRRVVAFDASGAPVLSVTRTAAPTGGDDTPLGYPRFADFAAGGALLVADSDGGRVLCCEPSGVEHWSVGPTVPLAAGREHALEELRVTRWAALDARGRLLVTDYWGSRVAVLERSAPVAGGSGQPALPSSGMSMSSLSS